MEQTTKGPKDLMIERSARLRVCLVPALRFTAHTMNMPNYPAERASGAAPTLYVARTGSPFTLQGAAALAVAFNVVAMPFDLLFDRHHKGVACRLRKSPGLRPSLPTGAI